MMSFNKNFSIKIMVIMGLSFFHFESHGGAYDSGSKSSGSQTMGMVTGLVFAGVGAAVAGANVAPCIASMGQGGNSENSSDSTEYQEGENPTQAPPGASSGSGGSGGSGGGAVKGGSMAPCGLVAGGLAGVGMGMMSFANMNQADDQSRATMADAMGTSYSPIPPVDKIAGTQAYKDFLAATEPLKQQGYSFDLNKGTVTTPVGTTVPASSLTNVDGLRAAGISVPEAKAFQNAFQNALKDINAKAQKAVADQGGHLINGFKAGSDSESGGGAEGSRTGSISKGWAEGGVFEGGGGSRSPSGKSGDHVAGLKKDYHGTPIGVSEDSIFDMAKRRYKLKGEQNSFLVQ